MAISVRGKFSVYRESFLSLLRWSLRDFIRLTPALRHAILSSFLMARRRTSYDRRAPLYHRITIIPGILYLNISRSGLSLSFGRSSVGRATVSKSGVRLNKSIGGFSIGKTFSFSRLAKLFGQGKKSD